MVLQEGNRGRKTRHLPSVVVVVKVVVVVGLVVVVKENNCHGGRVSNSTTWGVSKDDSRYCHALKGMMAVVMVKK